MRCTQCDSDNTKVLQNVYRPSKHSTNRRIECLDCGFRFTTIEFPIPEGMRPDPKKLIEYWDSIRRVQNNSKPRGGKKED